ncbi:MAG TPA: LEA type 2 family protein [Xylella sp.]
MRLAMHLIALILSGLILIGCGPVRRISEPTASLQQLSVEKKDIWSIDLRLQNYSNVPMRFQRAVLSLETGDQVAGTLDVTMSLSVGPESADVTSLRLQPSSLGKIAVADALAGNHALPYRLKGKIWATLEGKNTPHEFQIDTRNMLNMTPGLPGVLR